MSKARDLAKVGSVAAQGLTSRNKIINGAMVIDQRNAGASVTTADSYTLDRWKFTEDTDGAASIQQVTDAPTGFNNSAKVTVTTADASIGASQFTLFWQPIEGNNWADLGYGTASAKTSTLSFWVKSSVTGTFSGALENSAGDRSYIFTYSISSANTWEQKSVTITGDTTGTWLTTNGIGVKVFFTLTAGSNFQGTAGSWGTARFGATGTTQLMSTLNATWQVTGVQLEAGSTATPFEFLDYGRVLQQCQRYYEKSADTGVVPANGVYSAYLPAISHYVDNLNTIFLVQYKVTKRANPTVSFFGGSTGKWQTMKTDGTWGTILGSTYVTAGNSQGFCGQNSDWNGSSAWQSVSAGTGRMTRGDWVSESEL